jgi:hypothetical protein
MFGFDMLVCGVRGNQLPTEELNEEELEVYGVDWEDLQDDQLLQSQRDNNPQQEGWKSWAPRASGPCFSRTSFRWFTSKSGGYFGPDSAAVEAWYAQLSSYSFMDPCISQHAGDSW